MDSKKIIALGFFDGVHAGHGALLRECRRMADAAGITAAAVTFSAHPDTLVSGKTPGLINTAADRERLLRKLYRMDSVITLPFDREMMAMSYRAFFRLLLKKYGASGMVCGHDFRFGNRGEGNVAKLQALCAEAGIPCAVVPEQKIDGITVSSTYIRILVETGQMERAAVFLGHPHMFTGTVVPGRHIGRTLGVPTANLVLPAGTVCPKLGVYACRVYVDGEEYMAVTNVGNRPTVSGTYITVEPWILDFTGDLYGKELTLTFHSFLRPEQKFPTLEALREEIRKNAAQTRHFFDKS